MDPRDLVRLTVQCPELDYSISLPFRRVAQLSADRLLSENEPVLQSNKEFLIDQSWEIEVIKLPSGKGNKKKCYVDLEKSLKEKKSFIKINNRDQLCCARAIVTAKARIDKHPKWNSIRKGLNLFNTWYIILKEKWYIYHVLRVYNDFGLIWLFTISLRNNMFFAICLFLCIRFKYTENLGWKVTQNCQRAFTAVRFGWREDLSVGVTWVSDQHCFQRVLQCYRVPRSRGREEDLPVSPR